MMGNKKFLDPYKAIQHVTDVKVTSLEVVGVALQCEKLG